MFSVLVYTIAMFYFQDFLRTYLFLIPLFVMVLCECAKVSIEWLKTGEWHRRLFRHGGMPSSHSAFVTSLLIIVERKTGLESVEFAIAVIFACIVWYDAIAVRGELDKQAKALNLLQSVQILAEDIGHSFLEVVGGILFGAIATAVGIWFS